MNMALNQMIRREIDRDGTFRRKIVAAEAVYRLKGLQKKINGYHQELNRKSASRKRRHTEEDEKWELEPCHETATSTTSKSRPASLLQELREVTLFWTGTVPEILSRIQHASKSLFIEVSRGFFLPFCTVALSSLARIRSLLIEIGVRGLTKIRDLSDEVLQIFPENSSNHLRSIRPVLTDTDYQHCMNVFVEIDDNNSMERKFVMQNGSSAQDVIFDRSSILKSLGLMESSNAISKVEETLNCVASDAPTNKKKKNNEKESDNSPIKSSTDDYYTLSSSAPVYQHSSRGELDDKTIFAETDEGCEKMASKPRDSIDRNMDIVERFQRRKTNEKVSKKQDKKSTKLECDTEPQALSFEAERKNKKRKSKNKDSTKTKKKKKSKKNKSDFFDQLFE
jgi:hypothetical protein